MSVGTVPPPANEVAPPLPLYRFSVEQYRRMGETGVLTPEDRVELLEGVIVKKMNLNPPHAGCLQVASALILKTLSSEWSLRSQSPVTTTDSEPEPDLAIVRSDDRGYFTRHPSPTDVGLLIEIADSSLARDRGPKAQLYARAEIPTYWVVNLIDRQVEVYTDPTGPGDEPKYAATTICKPGEEVPVVLGGAEVGRLKVDDLLP